jgi:hypothetical protein
MDAGDSAGAVAKIRYGFNPITCLDSAKFQLNDQIIDGIDITSAFFAVLNYQ